MDLRKFFRVVRHRKWTFLFASVIALLAILLLPKRVPPAPPPIYVSTAKVLITPQNLDASVGIPGHAQGGTNPLAAWFADGVTLRELLTSEALLTRVAEKLPNQPGWLSLRGCIEVKPVSARSLSIFEISLTAPNSDQAQRATELLISEFSTYVQDLSSKEFASTRRYLEEQITYANTRVQKTRVEMERASAGLPSPEDLEQQARQRSQLQTDIVTLEQEISSLDQQVSQLQAFISGRSRTPPWQILAQKDTALSVFKESLSQERLALLELEKTFADGDEQITTQRTRVADQEELYLKQVVADVQSLASEKAQELAEKKGRLEANRVRLKSLGAHRVPDITRFKLDRLKRQLDMDQEDYIEVVRQLRRARVSEQASRRQGAITVLQRPLAGVANMVIVPQRRDWSQLLIAIPLCLMLGAGAALLAEQLQASLRLRPRIEATLGIPVLAVIPQLDEEITRSWDEIKQ